MTPLALPALAVAALAALAGCPHDHGDDAHDHAEAAGGEHAHGAHGDDPGHGAAAAGEPLERLAVTRWTERTELFAEYDPFVVGAPAAFAAHVTEMPSFGAVARGSLTVEVRMGDGAVLTAVATAPTSPGIFRPVLVPTSAGPCTLAVVVAGPALEDRVEVGPCVVHASAEAARAAAEAGDAGAGSARITFLKEQQWVTRFATAAVAKREMRDTVRALGTVSAAAGKDAEVRAPVAGWIEVAPALPAVGTRVEAGEVLARVAPRAAGEGSRASLEAEARGAAAELAQARAQLGRAERLFADGAAAQREVEEARSRVAVARARAEGAQGRRAQLDATRGGRGEGQGFEVRAPIGGTIVAWSTVAGASVESGEVLARVVDLEALWLVAHVFEPDLPKVAEAASATFTVLGGEAVHRVEPGRRVEVPRVLDPVRRTAPVVFALGAGGPALWVGQSAQVEIGVGSPREVVAVPRAALVAEAGREVVYVMVEGEAFERRVLTLGAMDQEYVEVLAGVAVGERVVTLGGYEIKLAAASGAIPAHGHAH